VKNMAIPQIVGAPTPSDPGGAFQGLIRSYTDRLQIQQRALDNILESLRTSREMQFRKDEQIRRINAERELEGMRQNEANRRASAEAARWQKSYDQEEAQDAYKKERDVQEDAIKEEERQYKRTLDAQDAARKTEAASLEASKFELSKQESATRLAGSWQDYQRKRASDFGRSMLPMALAMEPYEPGPIPGTMRLKPDFPQKLQGFSQAMTASGRMLGQMAGAPNRQAASMMQSGGMDSLIKSLEERIQVPNEQAVEGEKLRIDRDRLNAQNAADQGMTVVGNLPITPQALELIQKESFAPGDNSLAPLLNAQGFGSASLVWNGRTGQLEVLGAQTPEANQALARLNERVKNTPGALETLIGKSYSPYSTPTEQRGVGARIMAGGQPTGEGQPQAPAAQGQTRQGSVPQTRAPASMSGRGGAIEAPRSRMSNRDRRQAGAALGYVGATLMEADARINAMQASRDAAPAATNAQPPAAAAPQPRMATGEAADRDRAAYSAEAKSAQAAGEYLKKYGIGSEAVAPAQTPPPLDPWEVERQYGSPGGVTDSVRRLIGANPVEYGAFYEDIPEERVRRRKSELERRAAQPYERIRQQAQEEPMRSRMEDRDKPEPKRAAQSVGSRYDDQIRQALMPMEKIVGSQPETTRMGEQMETNYSSRLKRLSQMESKLSRETRGTFALPNFSNPDRRYSRDELDAYERRINSMLTSEAQTMARSAAGAGKIPKTPADWMSAAGGVRSKAQAMDDRKAARDVIRREVNFLGESAIGEYLRKNQFSDSAKRIAVRAGVDPMKVSRAEKEYLKQGQKKARQEELDRERQSSEASERRRMSGGR
jgi:hypothetical protein